MSNYRYATPHDWLIAKIQRLNNSDNISETQSLLQTLAYELDADKIQDIFQPEMDEDGYFEPLSEDKANEEE